MLVHVIKGGEGTVADGGKDPSLRRPLKLIRFSLGWSQCVLEKENIVCKVMIFRCANFAGRFLRCEFPYSEFLRCEFPYLVLAAAPIPQEAVPLFGAPLHCEFPYLEFLRCEFPHLVLAAALISLEAVPLFGTPAL